MSCSRVTGCLFEGVKGRTSTRTHARAGAIGIALTNGVYFILPRYRNLLTRAQRASAALQRAWIDDNCVSKTATGFKKKTSVQSSARDSSIMALQPTNKKPKKNNSRTQVFYSLRSDRHGTTGISEGAVLPWDGSVAALFFLLQQM